VVSWKVANHELLFVSPKNNYTVGKAIRGGIPVVFPQFGPGKLPQHGFARNKMWSHAETKINEANDATATFRLKQDEETLAVWPHNFELVLTIILKATSLIQQLEVINRDDHPFVFDTLLHTYIRTDHIQNTKVWGLKGVTYLDKPNNAQRVVETADPIVFTGEVDRVYIDGASRTVYVGDSSNAGLMIKSTGFKDFVVWNPAAEKARSMGDLGEENYPYFVCVEAGTVAAPITLEAGQAWTGVQELSVRMKEQPTMTQ